MKGRSQLETRKKLSSPPKSGSPPKTRAGKPTVPGPRLSARTLTRLKAPAITPKPRPETRASVWPESQSHFRRGERGKSGTSVGEAVDAGDVEAGRAHLLQTRLGLPERYQLMHSAVIKGAEGKGEIGRAHV